LTLTEAERKARNEELLRECYPTFAAKVAAVIADLEGHGLRPRIQDAYRSPEDQLKAYLSGASHVKFGFHNITGKGGKPEALAADILDDDRPLNAPPWFYLMLAASAESHGLITGIRWGLPAAMRRRIDDVIARRDWEAHVKMGWDPSHVQVAGLSILAAKLGVRP
jgi:hypothetical protein